MNVAEDPRLVGLEPRFREVVVSLLQDLEALGWQPRVASGLRTPAQQQVKLARGVSQTLDSMHIRGLAADIIDRRHGWAGPAAAHNFAFWLDLGRLAKAKGLVWGGDWKHFRDVAHVEGPRDDKVQERQG